MTFIFCLSAITYSDLVSLEIFEPALWGILVLSVCSDAPPDKYSLLGALVPWIIYGACCLICLLFKAPVPMGMGDIRLLSVLALYLGPSGAMYAFCASALLSGLFCIAMTAAKKLSSGDVIPYTPFICAGCLFYLLL